MFLTISKKRVFFSRLDCVSAGTICLIDYGEYQDFGSRISYLGNLIFVRI